MMSYDPCSPDLLLSRCISITLLNCDERSANWPLATGHLDPQLKALTCVFANSPGGQFAIRNSPSRPIPLKEHKGSGGPKYILPCTLYNPKHAQVPGGKLFSPLQPFSQPLTQLLQKYGKVTDASEMACAK